jgi:DNA uptake protein ComE-like DNA-binding protein
MNPWMFRKLFREFCLLPRGEQRALILVSLLLIISLGVRITIQMLPPGEPPGLDQFVEESRRVLAALAEADSLSRAESPVMPDPNIPAPGLRSTGRNSNRSRHLVAHPIEINAADSAGLLPLSGIGPVLAGRIIKYRNMLGGFVDKSQLAEVYGLPDEVLSRITPCILIDTLRIKKIEINTAGFRTLLRHPYLEYEDVKAIMNYREVMGQISNIREIRQNHLVQDSTLDRIRPYLDLSKE